MRGICGLLGAAALIAGTSSQATDCGASKGATGTFSRLSLTPQQPAAGQPVALVGTGVVSEAVTGGSAVLNVLYMGVNLFQGSFSTCGATNLSLPLGAGIVDINSLVCPTIAGKAGSLSLNITVAVPAGVPPGNYDVTLTANDQASKVVYCVDGKFVIGSAHDEQESQEKLAARRDAFMAQLLELGASAAPATVTSGKEQRAAAAAEEPVVSDVSNPSLRGAALSQ